MNVSSPTVKEVFRGPYKGGSMGFWDLVIEVEMSNEDPCDCTCCEVRYFTSYTTTETTPDGFKRMWDFTEVLPVDERFRLRPESSNDPADVWHPRSAAINFTPYRSTVRHPTATRDRFLVHMRPGGIGSRGYIGYIEDIGMIVSPERRKRAVAERTEQFRRKKDPNAEIEGLKAPGGVVTHPIEWLVEVNNTFKWSENPNLEKLFKLILHDKREELGSSAVVTGTDRSGDTKKSESDDGTECTTTIKDQPGVQASAGTAVSMERWYLVTVQPAKGCGGETLEKEIVLTMEFTGGSNEPSDENYDVFPIRRVQ